MCGRKFLFTLDKEPVSKQIFCSTRLCGRCIIESVDAGNGEKSLSQEGGGRGKVFSTAQLCGSERILDIPRKLSRLIFLTGVIVGFHFHGNTAC